MLARYLWAPSLTRDGLERTDILAVHSQTRRMIEVQVKTLRVKTPGGPGAWPLGRKGTRRAIGDHEWYVMVSLPPPPADPACYVVPRDHVAAATWIAHRSWLTEPGVPPGKRNAPIENARVDVKEWERYRDRWDDLRQPTTDLPVLLRPWMREAMREERVGLPDDHPWRDAAAVPDWPEPASP
jgi:hypothetical protein